MHYNEAIKVIYSIFNLRDTEISALAYNKKYFTVDKLTSLKKIKELQEELLKHENWINLLPKDGLGREQIFEAFAEVKESAKLAMIKEIDGINSGNLDPSGKEQLINLKEQVINMSKQIEKEILDNELIAITIVSQQFMNVVRGCETEHSLDYYVETYRDLLKSVEEKKDFEPVEYHQAKKAILTAALENCTKYRDIEQKKKEEQKTRDLEELNLYRQKLAESNQKLAESNQKLAELDQKVAESDQKLAKAKEEYDQTEQTLHDLETQLQVLLAQYEALGNVNQPEDA